MSLSRKIADVLDSALLSSGSAGEGPVEASAEDGGARLTLRLTEISRAGVQAESLAFQAAPRPGDWSIPELRAWGERLSKRLTYLMEPLLVLEVNAVDHDVEMRSQFPSQRSGRRSFYVAHIQGAGLLTMRRFAYEEETRSRKAIPLQLTREALERLTDDLVETSVSA